MPARFWVLLLAAALATGGLLLGAATQDERILVTQASDGPAGNLVVLTAPLVAAGVALGAWALRSPAAPWYAPLVLFVAVLFLVVMVQGASGLQKIEVRDDTGHSQAVMAINPYAHNGAGFASVLVPVLSLIAGGILLAQSALQRIWGAPPTPPTPRTLLRRLVAATALAVPFLIVTATGAIQILLAAPADAPGVGPYYVVLPAMVLVAVGLLVTSAVRVWNVFACVRNPRLLDLTAEAWRGVGRADLILVSAGAVIALASSALAKLEPAGLTVGATLAVTTRSHNQFILLLAIALIPLWRVHNAGSRVLADAPSGHGTLDAHGADPFLVAWVASLVAGGVLAPAAAFLLDGALWPWLAAFAPMALWALRYGDAGDSGVPLLLVAVILWGIGNTVSASFDNLGEAVLEYTVAPGMLALWRLLGVTVGGWALVRIAGLAAAPMAQSMRWPLALGLGLCASLVVLLEFPFAIWLVYSGQAPEVGIGSVVAAQEPAVRILMHTLAMALGVIAGVLLARLRRPGWFRRPAQPVAVGAGIGNP